MKRKIIIIIIILIVVGGIIARLVFNKIKIDEETKPKELNINVPVLVDTVSVTSLSNNFSISGNFEPSHQVTIVSETQGKLIKVLFDAGDYVKEGQILASCDIELLTAQKKLAQASLDKAKSDMKKFEEMYQSSAVSLQGVEEMKLAYISAETNLVSIQKQLEYAVIRAPFSGYITKKYIDKGSMLLPGSLIAEIIDINTLKFIADVSESDIDLLSKGQKVTIESEMIKGNTFTGFVKAIGVKADEAMRFPVEIEVKNNSGKPVRSGMFAVAYFECPGIHSSLMIPRTAIIGSIKDPKVFVVQNNTALLKSISIGRADDELLEVTSGLSKGELVVKAGQINLENGTKVKITNQ